jgi:hypothetical protein
MNDVLDRVRAANPARAEEFAGRANFEALDLKPRRRRKRLLSIPALGAIVAALVLIPSSAPQAKEIIRKSALALAVDDGILYARSHAQIGPTGGAPTWSGSREVWVRGDQQMHWLDSDGDEDVYAAGDGTTQRSADGKTRHDASMRMVPTEIFRARALANWKGAVSVEETDDAYVLRWSETRYIRVDFTLWVNKETYAPMRFIDHSSGNDYRGKPFDETYIEVIDEYKVLEDTPENRQLLELTNR